METPTSKPTRLINVNTLKLESFKPCACPPYAILSHTWGDGEISYEQWRSGVELDQQEGYTKIIGACKQAKEDGHEYLWADTCCIDKASHVELSEAINSMFVWYERSEVCYAHLADVWRPSAAPGSDYTAANSFDGFEEAEHGSIAKSRWFTRGWTLQELLAPALVVFFAADWAFLGSMHDLLEVVSETTGISTEVLSKEKGLTDCSIAQRISWAAHRETTKIEDASYCLLGIVGVHLPLLYGEGAHAFVRLQEEILKKPRDLTVLAWDCFDRSGREGVLLASAPSDFQGCGDIVADFSVPGQDEYWMTSIGLKGTFSVLQTRPTEDAKSPQHLALLKCYREGAPQDHLGLLLEPHTGSIIGGATEKATYGVATAVEGSTSRLGVVDFFAFPEVSSRHITVLHRNTKCSRTSAVISDQVSEDVPASSKHDFVNAAPRSVSTYAPQLQPHPHRAPVDPSPGSILWSPADPRAMLFTAGVQSVASTNPTQPRSGQPVKPSASNGSHSVSRSDHDMSGQLSPKSGGASRKQYTCPYPNCAYQAFSRLADLKRHIAVVHGRDVNAMYECPVRGCDYGVIPSFTDITRLTEHLRTAHETPGRSSDEAEGNATSFPLNEMDNTSDEEDVAIMPPAKRQKRLEPPAPSALAIGAGYICSACEVPDEGKPPKIWMRRDNLKIHVRREHSDLDTDAVLVASKVTNSTPSTCDIPPGGWLRERLCLKEDHYRWPTDDESESTTPNQQNKHLNSNAWSKEFQQESQGLHDDVPPDNLYTPAHLSAMSPLSSPRSPPSRNGGSLGISYRACLSPAVMSSPDSSLYMPMVRPGAQATQYGIEDSGNRATTLCNESTPMMQSQANDDPGVGVTFNRSLSRQLRSQNQKSPDPTSAPTTTTRLAEIMRRKAQLPRFEKALEQLHLQTPRDDAAVLKAQKDLAYLKALLAKLEQSERLWYAPTTVAASPESDAQSTSPSHTSIGDFPSIFERAMLSPCTPPPTDYASAMRQGGVPGISERAKLAPSALNRLPYPTIGCLVNHPAIPPLLKRGPNAENELHRMVNDGSCPYRERARLAPAVVVAPAPQLGPKQAFLLHETRSSIVRGLEQSQSFRIGGQAIARSTCPVSTAVSGPLAPIAPVPAISFPILVSVALCVGVSILLPQRIRPGLVQALLGSGMTYPQRLGLSSGVPVKRVALQAGFGELKKQPLLLLPPPPRIPRMI